MGIQNKQQITITIEEVEPDWLDGSIENAIHKIQALKASRPEFDEIFIHTDIYYESITVIISGTRLETDQELKDRLAKQRKASNKKREAKIKEKAKQDEKEYQEYLKLKKKYESDIG